MRRIPASIGHWHDGDSEIDLTPPLRPAVSGFEKLGLQHLNCPIVHQNTLSIFPIGQFKRCEPLIPNPEQCATIVGNYLEKGVGCKVIKPAVVASVEKVFLRFLDTKLLFYKVAVRKIESGDACDWTSRSKRHHSRNRGVRYSHVRDWTRSLHDRSNEAISDSCSINCNFLGIGLENIGVELDKKGKVVANAQEQTNVPNVFAIGDVLSERPELTPVAIKARVRNRLPIDFNWQITFPIRISHNTFKYSYWLIQTIRADNFEPWSKQDGCCLDDFLEGLKNSWTIRRSQPPFSHLWSTLYVDFQRKMPRKSTEKTISKFIIENFGLLNGQCPV